MVKEQKTPQRKLRSVRCKVGQPTDPSLPVIEEEHSGLPFYTPWLHKMKWNRWKEYFSLGNTYSPRIFAMNKNASMPPTIPYVCFAKAQTTKFRFIVILLLFFLAQMGMNTYVVPVKFICHRQCVASSSAWNILAAFCSFIRGKISGFSEQSSLQRRLFWQQQS